MNVVVIDLRLSQEQLADFIGTSRETVNRIMKELKDEETINTDNHRIFIFPKFYKYEIIAS